MLGKIQNIPWVTKIVFSKERGHKVRSCFNVSAEFQYPQNVIEFKIVIKDFQRKKENNSDNDSIFA